MGKVQCVKWTRQVYGSCALHFYLMRSIYLHSFLLIQLVVLEVCPGQDVERWTGRWTDKTATICSPFREHSKYNPESEELTFTPFKHLISTYSRLRADRLFSSVSSLGACLKTFSSRDESLCRCVSSSFWGCIGETQGRSNKQVNGEGLESRKCCNNCFNVFLLI